MFNLISTADVTLFSVLLRNDGEREEEEDEEAVKRRADVIVGAANAQNERRTRKTTHFMCFNFKEQKKEKLT